MFSIYIRKDIFINKYRENWYRLIRLENAVEVDIGLILCHLLYNFYLLSYPITKKITFYPIFIDGDPFIFLTYNKDRKVIGWLLYHLT